MCPTIRRCAPRHSSVFVLRSQRHRRRQRVGPPVLMARRIEHPMREVYFDPKRVGSYGGVCALRRVTRVPRKIVAEWLSEHDAYTSHKPARRHFKRRRVIVGGIRQQWQADLVDLTKLKNDNRSPHGDRRLLESGLVCSYVEQVRGVVGDSAANHVRQRLATDVAEK